MNYNIEERETTWPDGSKHIESFVVCEDGYTTYLKENREGYKYFSVKNPYYKLMLGEKDLTSFRDHFYHRIKDAVTAVREGHAHAIQRSGPINIFATETDVVWFVDEELGEKYRKKTIEGFKDAEFGYGVKFGSNNSFGGYNFVSHTHNICSMWNDDSPAFFDTEREAYEFIKDIYDVAKTTARVILHAEKEDRKQLRKDAKEKFGKFTITMSMIDDMVTNNKDELKYTGFDLVQMIKPKQ
jgi:hypothetical protein